MAKLYRHNLDKLVRSLNKASDRLGPFTEDALTQLSKKILMKVQKNMSGRILRRRTGKLFNSWDFRVTSSGKNKIVATIGSLKGNVPYSEIHDKGGKTGRGRKVTIPARRYYTRVFDEDIKDLDKIIAKNLKKIFK